METHRVFTHFAEVDPILSSEMRKQGKVEGPTRSPDYFFSLVREIVSQQLSEKAGATILGRVLDLFPDRTPTPELVLALPPSRIRAAGPAWSKVSYLRNLSSAVSSGSLVFEHLDKLDDEEVICVLTKVKGIGRWTSEMFLMFSLGRPDVFSHGDGGLRRAIMNIYRCRKPPTQKTIERLTRRWSPYRTYACRVLWNSLNTVSS
ncbi:MAG: DNA-3-methyladenine glycosylase 2 family protein [bacterium]|nr:DNA-3-methyladenine glycosylase 2 family protein [bacterium]